MEETIEPEALRIVACPRPFSVNRIDVQRPAGATVAGHMTSIGMDPRRIYARVFIDDRLIPQAEWQFARPEAGQLMTIRAIPTGGEGGESGGKTALRILAQIAVAMAAVAATAVGGPIAGAAVMILGNLAINGLIPSPLPRRPLPMPIGHQGRLEAA